MERSHGASCMKTTRRKKKKKEKKEKEEVIRRTKVTESVGDFSTRRGIGHGSLDTTSS